VLSDFILLAMNEEDGSFKLNALLLDEVTHLYDVVNLSHAHDMILQWIIDEIFDVVVVLAEMAQINTA
jgi:ABC-type iron transport system FetAB ATPase subunit